ncbi:MAG: UDP-N-acetylmuramoyl-L-alanine--D-glutamate ligase [Candidatus Planktophila sp.]|nr:UDP-N-acetylmuramoyl-L-alanine--D-glutamate ligase [Candidatus Planktophila sp.]
MPLNFAGRRVLVAGGGVTGTSVAQFLASQGAMVVIVDENPNLKTDFTVLAPQSVVVRDYSAVVLSPGWKESHPIVAACIAAGIEILNEIDVAWNIAQEIAPYQKWLALTGTNGKTTTVEMAAAMLQRAGLKAVACGNVGETVIDAVTHRDAFDYLILELSSFQLHWMKTAHFVSSAILNITEDHLDWHGGFDAYCDAKLSLLERSDMAILNRDDSEIIKRAKKWDGRKIFFSLDTPAPGELGVVENLLIDRAFVGDPQEAQMIAQLSDIQPTLPHSVSNALAAAGLARSIGVSYTDIQSALIDFHPGRHRIETILSAGGVSWVDDSKATNPHAAAASILSHLSVIWVAGGLAKGADMDGLVERAKDRIKAVILIGSDRDLIEAAFLKYAPNTPRIKIDADHVKGGVSNALMESVVTAAQGFATSGDTVLMAPACASMDQFISYADRGDRFAAAVKKLVEDEN